MTKYYKCPRCFFNWSNENENLCIIDPETVIKFCEYCEQPDRTELEILHRMVEVMPSANASDLPNFIRHLMNHVVLKD